MISYMISPLSSTSYHAIALTDADISPAIRTDHDSDSDQIMDSDEERDFTDQGSPSDFESEEDTQILATLLKHIPACINAADIELLLQDIPVRMSVLGSRRPVPSSWNRTEVSRIDALGRSVIIDDIYHA